MHDIEPFYKWRHLYIASEDKFSPFYGRVYNEFFFENTIYNYYIHPQWDDFGSETLYLKILFVDYDLQFSIIELIGEWNDCLYNDIMYLKRNVIDVLINFNIKKFILIGENVLNFHSSDSEYYKEWQDDIKEGWIIAMNFRKHVIEDFKKLQSNFNFLCVPTWRKFSPYDLFSLLDNKINGSKINFLKENKKLKSLT